MVNLDEYSSDNHCMVLNHTNPINLDEYPSDITKLNRMVNLDEFSSDVKHYQKTNGHSRRILVQFYHNTTKWMVI